MIKLFASFEDSKRPFLGPCVKLLIFIGVWLPEDRKIKIIAFSVQIAETVFIFTEFLDVLYIKNDIDLLLNNIKFSMQGVINICKAWTFIFWQKDWKTICEYITKADINNRTDPDKHRIINKYTRYSRIITYTFCISSFLTAFAVTFQPIFAFLLSSTYKYNISAGIENYKEVVGSWMPFEKRKMPGYFFACIIQTIGVMGACAWIISYDSIALSAMVFFRLELELLKFDSAKIFDGSPSTEESLARIKGCHKRHIELLRHVRLYDNCTSHLLMLYMFIITIMLCATAYQMNIETRTTQMLIISMYLMFGVSQLFLYCVHSVGVYYASVDLAHGPYQSKWWLQGISQRKNMCILITQFSKTIIFTAGPFTDLTLATFMNIIKGAYSYYTLL